MDEQKPEEMEGQIPASDLSQPIPEEITYQSQETSQPPEEIKYEAPETSQPPEEITYQSQETFQPTEEVRPQVIGTSHPPEEIKYEAQETFQPTEEVKYQSPETSQPTEEVKPQVIGAPQPPEERASGMAISAMVVGIVGILCSWALVFSLPLGITALVLGIIEFRRIKDGVASEKGRGMAIAGIILGSLTLFGAIVYIIVIALTAVSFATGMSALVPSLIEQFGTFY